MTHYICKGGCKGESEGPVACGGKSCRDYQKPMLECECEDRKQHEQQTQDGEASEDLAKPEGGENN